MILNRIVLLSFLSAIGVISSTLCAPALPMMGEVFSEPFSRIQFTISLFLVGNAFGQLFSGPLSDRFGQRVVLQGGLLLMMLASLACSLAPTFNFLMLARVFQGMGCAVGPVLARAIIAKQFSPPQSSQIQSYAAFGIGLASIFAIILSGELTLFSWRANFALAALLGALLLLWTNRSLSNTPSQTLERDSLLHFFTRIKAIFRSRCFIGSALSHALSYGLMYGYVAQFPFLMMEIFSEKNPVIIGMYSALMIGCYMLGTLLSARLVLKYNESNLIYVGLFLELFSGLLFLLPASHLTFFSALICFNISLGLILPLTAARALSPFQKHMVGSASSFLGLSYRIVGSCLCAALCQFPLSAGRNLGLAITLLSCICLASFWALIRARALPQS